MYAFPDQHLLPAIRIIVNVWFTLTLSWSPEQISLWFQNEQDFAQWFLWLIATDSQLAKPAAPKAVIEWFAKCFYSKIVVQNQWSNNTTTLIAHTSALSAVNLIMRLLPWPSLLPLVFYKLRTPLAINNPSPYKLKSSRPPNNQQACWPIKIYSLLKICFKFQWLPFILGHNTWLFVSHEKPVLKS